MPPRTAHDDGQVAPDRNLEQKRSSYESAQYHKQQADLANDPNIIRQPGPIPFSAWFIIITELCERFAFYGASLIFQGYLLKVLNQPKSSATAINRGFTFFAYFTAVIGAIIADTKLGKFRTILIFSVVYMLGLLLLTASSTKPSLEAGFGLPGFILATYVFIACGTGGIKANVSAFAAEQVKDGIHPTEDPKVYLDSRLTVESVFRYFYWAINLGAMLGQIICPSVSHTSYPLAFLIPACTFVIGIIVFVIGKNKYFTRPPNGSVLLKVFKCMSFASKQPKTATVEHWLDRSKGLNSKEWNDKFVDDLKRTLNACKVFLFYPFYWALYANMSDNFINQSINMKRPDWLDESQLNVINSLVLVISIPIFDRLIFPFLRNRGFRLGPITRITIGFIICIVGFIYVTVLQKVLYSTGPYYDFQNVPSDVKIPINDISVWWQMPPYAIIAISEIFSSATGLEFAYKQAAPELKSIVLSLFLLTNCGGSLIGMLLAKWSKDPLFVIVFAVQTSILGVITSLFWFLFRKYDDVEV